MPIQPLMLPIQTYEHRSKPASTSKIVNCYAEQLPGDAKSPVALSRAPGIKSWITVGDGPIRGMLRAYGTGYQRTDSGDVNQYAHLWVISGSELYWVHRDGISFSAVTQNGFPDLGTPGQISMSQDANQIAVVNQPDAYHHTTTPGSTATGQATSATFLAYGGAKLVEFLDNWILYVAPDSATMFGADIGTVVGVNDPLNFITAESSPDNIVSMIADHGQLILFGEETSEIWQNTGVAGFPFQKTINGVFNQGCAAINSPAKQDQTVFWLADDLTVRRLEGLTPVRVSTHGIEQILAGLADPSECIGQAYSLNGHLMYSMGFNERTLVFDVTTQTWHERQTYGQSEWNPRYFANVYDKTVVGDYSSNKIGYFDFDTYDEWSSTQLMSWTYQPVYASGTRAFHDKLEIIMETGIGLATGQGSDPQIMLEYSDDGGVSYTSLPSKDIGPVGRTDVRVIWSALGSARQRVYRASVSDPVKITITDTILSVRGGRL